MYQLFKKRFLSPSLSKIWITSLLVPVLLLSACAGSNDEVTAGEVNTVGSAAAAEDTTNTTADTSDAASTEAPSTAEGTSVAEETTEEEAASAAAAGGGVTVVSIDSVESIQSFRMRFSLSGLEGEQVSVEGEFIKEPPAQRLLVDMPGAAPQNLETLVVDGSRYTKVRNRWIQTPGNRFDMDEIAPFTPDLIAGDLKNVEEIGSETVNERATIHYRVHTDSLPPIPFNRNGEQKDLSSLGSVQLDLWVDEEAQFIVKMQAIVENADAAVPVEMTYEYYDFNAPITIEVPK